MSDFKEIHDKYYNKSIMFAFYYVRDNSIAEDIVSDSLVKLWQVMKKESVENIPCLLMTIIKNRALDHLKAKQRYDESMKELIDWQRQELSIRISTIESCNIDNIFSCEIQAIVSETLSELSPICKQIFEMSRYECMSNRQIAEALGISVKSVEYHITNALKKLRISLADYLPLCALLFINI